MTGELARIEALAERAGARIFHVHFSEPQLAPAPADAKQAARVFQALAPTGYAGWYSIEMRAVQEDRLGVLEAHVERLVAAAHGSLSA